MAEAGRRLARVVDTEAFTLAVAWGLVLVAVGLPLAGVCVEHLAAGRLLAACAVGAVALPVAGLSGRQAAGQLRRASRAAGGRGPTAG